MRTVMSLGRARVAFAALLATCAVLPVHGQELPQQPVSIADGRIVIGADVSVSATPNHDADGAWFNYTDYEHNALRLARVGVTAEVRLTGNVSVLTEVRSENGDAARPYALYVRVRPWRSRQIDFQAGRIPPTFGAFARRDYGSGNPLIGYPLAYQYLTAVRPDALPATTDDVHRMRARGWRPSYPLGSLETAPGMPLVTAFRWDTGVRMSAATGTIRTTAAVTTGTISDPRTRDTNGGKQIVGRVQWQPNPAFMLGGSAARGAWVADAVFVNAAMAAGPVSGIQQALGVDVEVSRGYWMVRGELVKNQWQVPTLASTLKATGGFAEGTFKVLPGLFIAGRFDRLSFGNIVGTAGEAPWDAPVTRLETGVGYYIQRNLLAKVAYQHNWRAGGLVRARGLVAGQLHFWL